MDRRRTAKIQPQYARSHCPVSCTLDIVGDKWTLLVVRDLFLGKKRYGEFAESPESIPTNILADRLKRLSEHGLVSRRAYQRHPRRYEYQLTKKGNDFGPVEVGLLRWGKKHVAGTRAAKQLKR